MWTGFAACGALVTAKWFWGIITEEELGEPGSGAGRDLLCSLAASFPGWGAG